MAEAEWRVAADPSPMLESLWGRASDRKMRLFAVACCRRVCEHLIDPKVRNALELIERAADGSDITRKLHRASEDLGDLMERLERRYGELFRFCDYRWLPTHAVMCLFDQRDQSGLAAVCNVASVPNLITEFVRGSSLSDYRDQDEFAEKAAQSHLLRDIFGPLPFCPVALDPSWLTSTVVALAQTIYAERAFDRLPILADALEDAGCDNADILTHCRGDGPHVRGCWVVDLILGKE